MATKRQKIIITGASSGLGKQMAFEFAKQGRELALSARRLDRLEALKAELESTYPNCRVHVAALDVTDFDAVFDVFSHFDRTMGGVDRVIVNAGMMAGGRIGRGKFSANALTVQTNATAALAQCEAALDIFRRQESGHLVMMSSMSAFRGLAKYLTTYAATKKFVAHLMEGIRADLIGSKIKASTIYPGFIRTELNEGAGQMLFEIDQETGGRLLHKAIETERSEACVPWLPWAPMSLVMRYAPLSLIKRML